MDSTLQTNRSFSDIMMQVCQFVFRTFLIAILALVLGIGMIFLVYFGDLIINTSLGNGKAPIFGAYVIASPSMFPTIQKNDAIIIKRVDHDNYDVGDIITYASLDNTNIGRIVTHRIIEKDSVGTENSYYKTKGDNNTLVDPVSVNTSEIYGKVIFRVPKIGYIQDFFSKPSNYFICLLIPAFILVVYEVVRIFKLLKERNAY